MRENRVNETWSKRSGPGPRSADGRKQESDKRPALEEKGEREGMKESVEAKVVVVVPRKTDMVTEQVTDRRSKFPRVREGAGHTDLTNGPMHRGRPDKFWGERASHSTDHPKLTGRRGDPYVVYTFV